MDILIHEILEAQPDKNCVVVSRDKLFARPARALKKRTRLLKVEAPFTYRDRIEEAANLLPGLLVVDRLYAESLIPAFQAVESGLKVIAQLDTILRGENVKRQLQDMGALLPSYQN